MLSEEEIVKQRERREKRKKILLIFICAVIIIFVLFGIIVLILSAIDNYSKSQTRADIEDDMRQSYIYPDPDYDYNIFEDDGYMNLGRGVWYNDGVSKTVISDDNYTSYPLEIRFMYDVVNLIINGDYTEYNKIFTEDYLKNAGDNLREEFTMQQLFEIELEYVTNEATDTTDVMLTYRIRNNNGTFRNDLDFNDDGARPVVYMLTTDGEEIKVTNILTRRQYESGAY